MFFLPLQDTEKRAKIEEKKLHVEHKQVCVVFVLFVAVVIWHHMLRAKPHKAILKKCTCEMVKWPFLSHCIHENIHICWANFQTELFVLSETKDESEKKCNENKWPWRRRHRIIYCRVIYDILSMQAQKATGFERIRLAKCLTWRDMTQGQRFWIGISNE